MASGYNIQLAMDIRMAKSCIPSPIPSPSSAPMALKDQEVKPWRPTPKRCASSMVSEDRSVKKWQSAPKPIKIGCALTGSLSEQEVTKAPKQERREVCTKDKEWSLSQEQSFNVSTMSKQSSQEESALPESDVEWRSSKRLKPSPPSFPPSQAAVKAHYHNTFVGKWCWAHNGKQANGFVLLEKT